MTCPACGDRPPMTDSKLCHRCYGHAKEMAAKYGDPGEQHDDDVIEVSFIAWAKNARKNGGSLALALMVEMRKTPGVQSDSTFMRSWQRDSGQQFENQHPDVRAAYLAPAKKAGVSIKGKVYFNELAAYPGDPRAWVSDKGEARRVVEERGWSCPELGVGPSKDLQVNKAAKRARGQVREYFKKHAGV